MTVQICGATIKLPGQRQLEFPAVQGEDGLAVGLRPATIRIPGF